MYATGGAAEFFSLEMDEFKALVKIYAKATDGWGGESRSGVQASAAAKSGSCSQHLSESNEVSLSGLIMG